MKTTTLFVVALLFISTSLQAEKFPPVGLVAATNLDEKAFTEWVDGKDSPAILPAGEAAKGASFLLWTDKGGPGHSGLNYGVSKLPGFRHLRIAFREPVLVGSILVEGNGTVSVLNTAAAYPGDLGDDQQWLAAQRLGPDGVTKSEVARNAYTLWVLPKPMPVRAIRFSHEALATDKMYAGWLGGAAILNDRVVNIAPQAIVSASGNNEAAAKVNNQSSDNLWGAWDNAPEANAPAISPEHPAWVMLTWPHPVTMRGLNALWAGFSAAEVEIYTGPADRHPREATKSDWKTVASFDKIDHQYPRSLGVNWMDFGRDYTTRAIRLRITKPIDTARLHDHLKGRHENGRRVWLGELLALQSIGVADLASVVSIAPKNDQHPPIPVRFSLTGAGYVTLTIDDEKQVRIRNLVRETLFPAGENTVWWDGLDDHGRDPDAARHGLYNVPGSPVLPGDYTVHGIWHKDVSLKYEFPVYTGGHPAWNTEDKTGAWLANHTPPQAALFIPAAHSPVNGACIYLGSYVSEGTHGLAWVDLDGKKIGGVNWVGGNWTGAPYLARDGGLQANAEHIAYVGSVWSTAKGSTEAELRITAMTRKGEQPVYKEVWPLVKTSEQEDGVFAREISGIAVHNQLLVVALKRLQKLIVIDLKTKLRKSEHSLVDLRGIAFDPQGRLLVLIGQRLVRFSLGSDGQLGDEEIVLQQQLEDPQQVTTDPAGRYYISDWGQSHQVKVFDAHAKLQLTIGRKGIPLAGPYDQTQMRRPFGLTLDDRGRLWVAEYSDQPKRVSVWKPDGTFEQAFYGPSEYGGGGTLDSQDASQFHYHGMTFALDWKTAGFKLQQIYYPGTEPQPLAFRSNFPEAPVYKDGRRYWHNGFNGNPTGGQGTAFVFTEREGIAVAAAGCGRASDWDTLKTDAFRDRWPAVSHPRADRFKQDALFVWSDLNGDGHAQPDEVTIIPGKCGGVTVMNDLAFVVSRMEGKTLRFPVQQFTRNNVPIYDVKTAETLADGVEGPKSSGGDQALVHPNGWTVVTLGVAPFSSYSISGVYRGQPRWEYPNAWPGLHASHEAPVPDRPGMLVGPTRLLGGWVEPRGSDAGPIWFINGNMGTIYVFTADGMFVRTLFQDSRTGKPWAMPRGERGMRLNDITLHDENFWSTVTQTSSGEVFLQDGGRSSLVRVDGLETLRRLPPQKLHVGPAELQAVVEWRSQAESVRQREQGTVALVATMLDKGPTVDGSFADWSTAQWAVIDRRGTKANFNSNSKPYDISAALAVADGHLFAAFRTGDKELLKNSGEQALAPFKTGGALDLMLGTDPNADPKRTRPVPGDLRLLVSLVPDPNGKGVPRTKALLYRAVVPGIAEKDRIPFSSPWRTIYFDRVEDVSDQVTLAGQNGDYEFSVPLATLGLRPSPGLKLKGDLGVLRGNGFQTNYRVYWTNKATAITADVPSEAELTPGLWGTVEFQGK